MSTVDKNDDYDSPWKDVLDTYFRDFMSLFLPDAHQGIDWSRGWESLDTELAQITPDADTGKRLADKLIKVWRTDGVEQWVYIHVEVQNQRDRKLPARMATYHYRLLDRYNAPIVSIAVLGDDNRRWRPGESRFALWGCERYLRYPVIKLLDYEKERKKLEASNNPFALTVLAHLDTRQTHRDPEARRRRKMALVKRLYTKNFTRSDILSLFRFIDWLLALPPELADDFMQELTEFEASMGNPYVTSVERRGIQKGIQQGEVTLLQRQLRRRFGELPDWVVLRLHGAVPAQLEIWGERLLDADSLEAVFDED